jgi:hypothetical protein
MCLLSLSKHRPIRLELVAPKRKLTAERTRERPEIKNIVEFSLPLREMQNHPLSLDGTE